MILLQSAFPILCLTASAVLVVFLIQKVKALFVVGGYSVSREVEMGEGCSVSYNHYLWDSEAKLYARYQKAVAPIEERKFFCNQRFQEKLKEARAEQEGA